VTSEPRAFLALDSGAATTAAALIGRVGGRWRLIGSLSMPAGADVEAIVSQQPMPYVLLGNSFISRFSMRRGADQMVLEKRY